MNEATIMASCSSASLMSLRSLALTLMERRSNRGESDERDAREERERAASLSVRESVWRWRARWAKVVPGAKGSDKMRALIGRPPSGGLREKISMKAECHQRRGGQRTRAGAGGAGRGGAACGGSVGGEMRQDGAVRMAEA